MRKWRKATRRALLGAAAASVAVTHHRLHAFRFALGLWVAAARDSALGHVGAEHYRARRARDAELEAFAWARARSAARARWACSAALTTTATTTACRARSPTRTAAALGGYSPFRPVSASSALEYPVLPAPQPAAGVEEWSAPAERPAWK